MTEPLVLIHVGEDMMAFGAPTRYLQLDPKKVQGLSWNVRTFDHARVTPHVIAVLLAPGSCRQGQRSLLKADA